MQTVHCGILPLQLPPGLPSAPSATRVHCCLRPTRIPAFTLFQRPITTVRLPMYLRSEHGIRRLAPQDQRLIRRPMEVQRLSRQQPTPLPSSSMLSMTRLWLPEVLPLPQFLKTPRIRLEPRFSLCSAGILMIPSTPSPAGHRLTRSRESPLPVTPSIRLKANGSTRPTEQRVGRTWPALQPDPLRPLFQRVTPCGFCQQQTSQVQHQQSRPT